MIHCTIHFFIDCFFIMILIQMQKSHLVASLPTSRQQVVFPLLVPSCQQVWKKLVATCSNFVDIIRLVARLFQQVRYSHDITILLQPCVINLAVISCMTVSDLLEQPCNKSNNKLINSLLQTCFNNWEQAVRTQFVDSL